MATAMEMRLTKGGNGVTKATTTERQLGEGEEISLEKTGTNLTLKV